MELGKILEFRRDLYFEGAVQADWFYSQEKAAKVAENFVFHGKQYFGVEDQGAGKKRIDTISLVEELTEKMSDDHANALTLAIADYGTGKSHLAVTLGQIFSGKDFMRPILASPRIYKSTKILHGDVCSPGPAGTFPAMCAGWQGPPPSLRSQTHCPPPAS